VWQIQNKYCTSGNSDQAFVTNAAHDSNYLASLPTRLIHTGVRLVTNLAQFTIEILSQLISYFSDYYANTLRGGSNYNYAFH
jgi:hypothetical protein